MNKILTVTLLGALSCTGMFADEIRGRQRAQQARIAQGARSGELTPRETARIEGQEARLAREVRRDRVDGGGLSVRERAKINAQQNRMSREIHRQKTDGQVR